MSLITRCPACGTMFKVVADQLRISDGWVRCGHCSEIFDANAHMQDAAALAAAVPARAADPWSDREADALAEQLGAADGQDLVAPPADAAPLATLPPEGHGPTGTALVDDATHPASRPSESHPVPAPAPAWAPTPAEHGALGLRRAEALAAVQMRPAPDTAQADGEARDASMDDAGAQADGEPQPLPPFYVSPSPEEAPVTARDPVEEEEPEIWARSEQEPDLQDLEFVRKAQRRAMWQRRSVRLLLALGLAALGLLLVAQVALQERDRLAAAQPGLQPLLSALCATAGCRVGPPRQIDAIAIDASQFTRLRGDSYRLSLTLRNQASTPLAMPAIELTLTDSQDQPVVRRVLPPAELAPGVETLPANAEWSGAVGVGIATAGLPARIAGYRVLAFYP